MATKLMELEADIILNADSFVTDLSNAVDDAKTLATEIDDLNTAPVGVSATRLNNVVGDATKIKLDIDSARQAADDTGDKLYELGYKGGQAIRGLLEIFAGVAGSVVETVVAGIFELGAEGIEKASATDSPLAQAYNRAVENLDITRELTKLEVGEALLPLATKFQTYLDKILSSILGFDKADKVLYFLDQVETYRADNLKTVAENVEGLFSAFESVQVKEDLPTIESMSEGVESQTQYWEDYVATLESLKSKGVDTQFLADLATGSVESFAQLQALDAADLDALEEFMTSMSDLQAAESAAAESINNVQVDAYLGSESLKETFVDLVDGINQEEAAKLSAQATTDGIIYTLAAAYPQVASWVDAIRAEFAELGMLNYTPSEGLFSPMDKGTPKVGTNSINAHGLSYVPYDGYIAELHAGERILTRQQADEWRAGSTISVPPDPAVLEAAFESALSRWLAPVGTNQVIGIVNNGLANETRGIR